MVFKKKQVFSKLPAPQKGAVFVVGALVALTNGDTERYTKWIQGGYSQIDAETVGTGLVFLLQVYQKNPHLWEGLFARLSDMDEKCKPLVVSVTEIVKRNGDLDTYQPVNNSCQTLLIAKLITGIVGDRAVFDEFTTYLETFTPST